MKRDRPLDVPSANKKALDERQRLLDRIESLQNRNRDLEKELKLTVEMACQALRDQERAFVEWQRCVQRAYSGVAGALKPVF